MSDTEGRIVAECVELQSKYGTIPFDKAIALFQDGWWKIADKYGTTGPEVFKLWMDWKSKQK